ncbi:TonB-dependent receptor [Hyphococcus lacteus]|uniref:TonB-dependent receptor n=1 Tax=Hyphococcus lacteus TaxID=3143536 RepID=A0ABV3Z754_9PROT
MRIKESLGAAHALAFAGLLVAFPAQAEITENSTDEDTIVVTATRTEKLLLETPASVSVQNMELLRERGFTYGTDEFRGVPGVFFRRGEGDGDEFPFITIRGVTGNHGNDTFLALIDGIPFVGPDEEVLLTEVPYGSVENVEIVRGPVSALYGRGAIAGAVNYLTRTPSKNGARLEFTGGSDDYYRVAGGVEGVFGDVSILADAAYENYEGWRENSARETLNLFLKGVWAPTDQTAVTGYLSYINREAEVPSTIPTLADGTIVDVIGGRESFLGMPPTNNDVEGFIGALRLNHEFNDQLSVQLTGHARHFDSDVRLNFYDAYGFDPSRNVMAINGFASQTESTVFVGEALVNWNTGRHNIVAGLSAERATLDEVDRWSGQFGFTFDCGFAFYLVEIDYATGALLNQNNACFVNDQLRTNAETTNTFWSAFVQDEISLTSNLTLTVGARYDAFRRNVDFNVLGAIPTDETAEGDEGAFAPKASLAYDYGPGIFYASYGRGFNSNFGPIFQWDTSQYARVERPTTIDSFELGWKGAALDGQIEWETAVFYLTQRNRRLFVSNPDPMGPSTLATTGQKFSSRGLEASFRAYPTDRTKVTLNYTYLDPEWDELILSSFGGDIDLTGTDPTGVADHIVYAEINQEITDWLSATATYEYYSDYQITQENNVQKAGAYDLVNLSATARLPGRDDFSLSVSVLNLFDNEYYYFFGGLRDSATNVTPGAPRQFRATLKKTF